MCVRRRRVYGSLTGGTAAKRSSARTCRFCTFRRDKGRGDGARGAAAFAGAAGGAGLAAAFLLDKIGRSDSCRSAKGGAGVLCGGDAMRSGVPCRKTEYGAAILVAEQIWNGYPLLRNGIGRAALLRYKPAWRRRNTPARRTVGRTGAEAGGMNRLAAAGHTNRAGSEVHRYDGLRDAQAWRAAGRTGMAGGGMRRRAR